MSYSRTVRCRHCYKEGHNVKSCEVLTKEVKDNPDGYYYRRYKKYFNPDGIRKKASVVKKCSYCNEPGHTKRTCDTKLNDMIANIKTNAEYRRDMYNFLKEKGLGVGSLVTIHKHMYLVTGIDWDNFSCGDNRWDKSHVQLHSVDGNSNYTKFAIDEYIIKYDRQSIKVDSPEHNIPEPSSEWFSGRSEYYKDFQGLVSNPFRFEPRRF
jgi:hypothetical protein